MNVLATLILPLGLLLGASAQAEPCGIISTFFDGPKAQDIYTASVVRIGDDNVQTAVVEHRVAPGHYVLRVHEYIDSPDLRVKGRDRHAWRELEITVEPGKRYYIGAQFDHKHPFSREHYWTPIVWKVSDSACER